MNKLLTGSAMLALCGLTCLPAWGQNRPRTVASTKQKAPAQSEQGALAPGNLTSASTDGVEFHPPTRLPDGIATDNFNNVVLSADGRVGFFSAAFGNSIYAFNARTGELLSSINTGKRAAHLSIFDDGRKRLLAIVNLNDSAQGASISIIDAANANKLALVSVFFLPPETGISPTINPVFDRDGASLLIAGNRPGALILFDTATGQLLDRAELNYGVDSLSIARQDSQSIIGAVGSAARAVTIFQLSAQHTLQFQSRFELPSGYGLIANNNLCFNQDGTIGYLASFQGNYLFSFDTATGLAIDNYAVGDAPAQVAWTTLANKPRIAVVNTGLNHGFLADSVSIIETSEDGHFGTATVFLSPANIDLTPESEVIFNRLGNIGFVGAANHSLFIFDTASGEQLWQTDLAGAATHFTYNQQSRRLALISPDANGEWLATIKLRSDEAASLRSPSPLNKTFPIAPKIMRADAAATGQQNVSGFTSEPDHYLNTPLSDHDFSNNSLSASASFEILAAHAHRVRRGLLLTVDGEGFQPGAELIVNDRNVPANLQSSRQLSARVSWKSLGRARELAIAVRNQNGATSTTIKKRLRRRR